MDATLETMLQLKELIKKRGQKKRSPELQKKVEKLRARVSPHLLRHFDHLIGHGRSPVGLLSDSGACATCHLRLTPDEVLHIRNIRGRGFTCPHCGCFLYVADGNARLHPNGDTGTRVIFH